MRAAASPRVPAPLREAAAAAIKCAWKIWGQEPRVSLLEFLKTCPDEGAAAASGEGEEDGGDRNPLSGPAKAFFDSWLYFMYIGCDGNDRQEEQVSYMRCMCEAG